MFFKKLKMLFTGIALVGLGAFSLAFRFIEPQARLPFWPVDGVLAIAGGIFVAWWTIGVMRDED
jgi:hypothetical protein